MSRPDTLDFLRVDYKEPHLERARKLLAAHPEVKALCGPTRITALCVLGLVAGQFALAWALRDSPWWAILATSWLVGAFLSHGLWVLIHECTHNLVFASPRANAVLQMVANLPILFPAAISFRKYHLLHHRHQGDPQYDADLASPLEARIVGNGFFGKAFWMLNFWAFQALRVGRLKNIPFFDGWYVANLLMQVACVGGVAYFMGWSALGYLFLASIFAIGLHPVGARWIQEHYLTDAPQETYSYYGPLNRVAFNVGFHNEHHDVMRVPWTRLPKVREMAPEFYTNLVSHTSWTRLWLRFLFDSRLSLYSRVVRDQQVQKKDVEEASRIGPSAAA
jgi:sphingolipid delta-4 desaturase